jgi:hypothetical protein
MKLSTVGVLICGIVFSGTSVGCLGGVGNAPAGMSEQDAKSAIARMKPEDKIKAINSSPMPPQEKQKEYDKIEKETGVKASDVLSAKPDTGVGSR